MCSLSFGGGGRFRESAKRFTMWINGTSPKERGTLFFPIYLGFEKKSDFETLNNRHKKGTTKKDRDFFCLFF